jgi:hypothetical protein
MKPTFLLWMVFAILALAPHAVGQGDKPPLKEDDEVTKLVQMDPYTGGDAAAMAAGGIVAYAPFVWADHLRTDDVDRLVGEKRVLWLETAHFRVGCNLRSMNLPDKPEERKQLLDDVKAVRKKLPKVPEKPKKIDPWLRAHIYAHRAEAIYAEFQKLIGVTDADFPAKGKEPPNGAFLGLPDKFLILLFQKKSDMARYMDRYFGSKEDTSMREYHKKTHQVLFILALEGMEDMDEAAMHAHFNYAIWQNLMNGYRGYLFPLPLWLSEGIAHHFSRRIETDFLNVKVRDDEAVAQEKQNDWPVKVRRRAQHEALCVPFEKLAAVGDWQAMGFQEHTQSWSRIDYLMKQDAAKVGLLLRQLKKVAPDGTFEGQGPAIRALAQKQVQELFGMDAATFDQKWRDWVLKTYPKK